MTLLRGRAALELYLFVVREISRFFKGVYTLASPVSNDQKGLTDSLLREAEVTVLVKLKLLKTAQPKRNRFRRGNCFGETV